MVADIASYAGREQAYVKHYFLESYLESLIHKTASTYRHIAYIDGFSGPWQSKGENFEDTSFGIALAALTRAKASWRARGRDVQMSAFLVERTRKAYESLAMIGPRFPDVTIHTYNDDFVALAPKLLTDIPKSAFAFFFIDPKGWRIDIKKLASLLARKPSEVVFNFMFEFINRAASMGEAVTVSGLNELMPEGKWRERLSKLATQTGPEAAGQRKAILGEAFSETLGVYGNYTYVAPIDVLRPLKDRTLYSLVYATRHPTGIEVFRSAQLKTLKEQAAVRTATKRAHAEATTGQLGLFDSSVQTGPSEIEAYLEAERQAAETLLVALTPVAPATAKYGDLWPGVLAKHAVTRADINAMAARLRRSGALVFDGWQPNKRVPDDVYRVARPSM